MKEGARHILKTLHDNSHQGLYAGGCVRDELLGLVPHDYDIVTDALPEQIESLFDNTIDTGKRFGTITVMLNKVPYEVTTFRSDIKYDEGSRHPHVEFTDSAEVDAKRRDITINGMFMGIEDILTDYVGGAMDLHSGIIRMIGAPYKRIEEDPLRILRAIRFKHRFEFEMHPATVAAIRHSSQLMSSLSKERIKDEVDKMLLTCNPDFVDYIGQSYIEKYVFTYYGTIVPVVKTLLKKLPKDNLNLRWAALLCGVDKEHVSKILKNLKAPNKLIKYVHFMRDGEKLLGRTKPSEVHSERELYADERWDDLFLYISAISPKLGREVAKKIAPFDKELPKKRLNGNTLLEMGFKQGPYMKDIIKAAWVAQLNE